MTATTSPTSPDTARVSTRRVESSRVTRRATNRYDRLSFRWYLIPQFSESVSCRPDVVIAVAFRAIIVPSRLWKIEM